MSNEKLMPKLRFDGFKQNKWKETELGNIANLSSSKRVHQSDYVEYGIPFFRGSEISKLGNSSKLKDVFYISKELFNELKIKHGVPKIGDILITAVGTLGNSYLISNDIPFYFKDGNLIWLSDISIESEYLSIYLSSEIGRKKVLDSAVGSNQKALTMVKLQNVNIFFPDKEEQNKIGSFFKQLDEMIQLQQSKVNKVKDIKSAYLSEMFPKEGEKSPKKRFEGFTEAWKTIKMRDVFPTVLSGNRLPKTSLKSGNIPYILATTENNGVYARIDKETRDYHGNNMKTFNTPSISFSIDNPEAIFLQEENFFTSNIMRVLINKVLDKEGYIFFVETLRKATGGFDWGVKFSGPVVLDLDINVPFNRIENKIDYQEIKKIGLFISKLDEAEKLENIKLDKLKKLKQAYLNDMFI